MHPELSTEDPLVQVQVVIDHALSREVTLHVAARCLAVEFTESPDRCHGPLDIARLNQEAADAIVDQLGHLSSLKCDHRCARGHRFDHGKPKWLLELNQMQQRRRAT